MDSSGHIYAPTQAEEATSPAILWVCDDPPAPNIQAAIGDRYRVRPVPMNDSIERHAAGACGVVINATGGDVNVRRISALLDQLERTELLGLLLVDERTVAADRFDGRLGPFAVVAADSSPDVIAGHLAAMTQFQPAMAGLRVDLAQARAYGNISAKDLSHLEEEMRLAARLQRDFMPQRMPEVDPIRFGIMFRPAAWVSGDIFDVFRLDERHVGFYVADAVGHGMPAALLTMFIKRALPTKHIGPDGYEIVSPEKAMAELNEAICDQNLSSCQFCSAVYGVVNADTLQMTYARGGHPEPLLLHADGRITALDAPGGLLGIFPEDRYTLGTVQLVPGDRVVLYSDGAEGVFRHGESSGRDEFIAEVNTCRHLSPELMSLQLAGIIDDRQDGHTPEDDITILLLDVAP